MSWSKLYTLDFGAAGDTVSQAADKLEDNVDDIITNMNLLKGTFVGTTAPTSPDTGQMWLDSNTTPYTQKYYNGAAWVVIGVGLPRGYIVGLGVSHGTDTEHDISIAAGFARDATNAVDMDAAILVKQADAAWAVGTTKGGMATGESLPTSGTIHLWLIKRSDTGVVDAMFNNHATTALAPTLPTNYDYKRRIASFRTDGSANIINGDQWGTGTNRIWMYDTPILDIDDDNPGTAAVSRALSVPNGIIVKALFNAISIQGDAASIPQAYFSSLANADLAPSVTAAPLGQASAANIAYGPIGVLTNTSGEIRSRVSDSNAPSY
jgi:hypothetical protein